MDERRLVLGDGGWEDDAAVDFDVPTASDQALLHHDRDNFHHDCDPTLETVVAFDGDAAAAAAACTVPAVGVDAPVDFGVPASHGSSVVGHHYDDAAAAAVSAVWLDGDFYHESKRQRPRHCAPHADAFLETDSEKAANWHAAQQLQHCGVSEIDRQADLYMGVRDATHHVLGVQFSTTSANNEASDADASSAARNIDSATFSINHDDDSYYHDARDALHRDALYHDAQAGRRESMDVGVMLAESHHAHAMRAHSLQAEADSDKAGLLSELMSTQRELESYRKSLSEVSTCANRRPSLNLNDSPLTDLLTRHAWRSKMMRGRPSTGTSMMMISSTRSPPLAVRSSVMADRPIVTLNGSSRSPLGA